MSNNQGIITFNFKVALLLVFISFISQSTFAQEKRLNIRIGYPLFIIEYGKSKWGIGLGFRDFYKNQMIGDYDFKYSAFRVGLRTSYYPSDFGKDSFYFSVEGGLENRVNKATIASLAEDFEGTANGTFMASHAGYHWFWKTINISFGLGALSNNHPSYIVNGNKGSTITVPNESRISPSFELSLGYLL